jgi:hypothetical protein
LEPIHVVRNAFPLHITFLKIKNENSCGTVVRIAQKEVKVKKRVW